MKIQIINTTSSLGFADVAQFHKPLYPYNQIYYALAIHLPVGELVRSKYFVIPFLGPSTIKESVGTLLDSASSAYSYFVPLYVSLPAEALFAFNTLDDVYIPYENLKANAFEPYIAIKNAYLENLDYKRPIILWRFLCTIKIPYFPLHGNKFIEMQNNLDKN